MKTLLTVMFAGMVSLAAARVPEPWSTSKMVLGRNSSMPRQLAIKQSDYVQFTNGTGGRALLWFRGRNGFRLFVEPGGSLVKFHRAGAYYYSVHVSLAKPSGYNGEVIVE